LYDIFTNIIGLLYLTLEVVSFLEARTAKLRPIHVVTVRHWLSIDPEIDDTEWPPMSICIKSPFLRATAGTAIARLSHRNSVRPSVRLSVCHTGGSGKNGAS